MPTTSWLFAVITEDEKGEARLRLRLVDPKVINPDTPMPAYYKVEGLYRVEGEYRGKPIYSAQDVEDVIAYLLTLTDDP